jgi:signal transduction histidine kinase
MLLQGRIEAMQDGVVPFDEEGLGVLHTETLRLVRLVGQIERLAEAEAQPAPLALRTVRLDELARELHAALAPAFEMRGIELELDAAAAPAQADVDATRQIVTNLLSNALKYAPVGQPVRLTTAGEDGAAVIAVHDGGCQVTPDDRERVFERFYRGSEAARTSAGAGLGLTIARNLAEAQGGRLEMEVGAEGTSLVLRLPAGTAEAVSSPSMH